MVPGNSKMDMIVDEERKYGSDHNVLLSLNGCGMGPLLVVVSPRFREK